MESSQAVDEDRKMGRFDGEAVPKEVPALTELMGKIPSHCFQSDLTRSLKYVIKDLLFSISLYALIIIIEMSALPLTFKLPFYPCYWFLQGTIMGAMFVIAHECGHGSFSSSSTINDIVGNFLNSLTLVPYYPWKLSHQHHHKNTGNIDKDEVYYPTREKETTVDKRWNNMWGFGLGIGWFGYLLVGYGPRPGSHYNLWNPLLVRHAGKCFISLCCNLVWVAILYNYYLSFGFFKILNHYLIPLFVCGSWIVITTFLHHHDDNVPWYADHKWDYVRGQLSTVDRDYGWAHSLIHNSGTHQIHHMFPKIPHYHLEEATEAFRKEYPELVRINNKPIIQEFFRRFKIYDTDRFISDDKDVHVFGGVCGQDKKHL